MIIMGVASFWAVVHSECLLSFSSFFLCLFFLSLLLSFLYEQSVASVIEKINLELSMELSKKRLCSHKSVVNLGVILFVAQHCPSPGTSS